MVIIVYFVSFPLEKEHHKLHQSGGMHITGQHIKGLTDVWVTSSSMAESTFWNVVLFLDFEVKFSWCSSESWNSHFIP